jgi:hypothetical protein
MWWIFRAAVARKVAYLLVALVFALLLGHRAHSQSATMVPSFSTMQTICAAAAKGAIGGANVPPAYVLLNQASANGVVSNVAGSFTCEFTFAGVTHFGGGGTFSETGSCAGLGNQDILAVISAASWSNPATGHICSGGCDYTNGAVSGAMHITGGVGGGLALIGQAVPSGGTCSASAAPSSGALASSNCLESGGTTSCHDAAAGVAIVNGDVVNPAAPPPAGQCSSFADGAVECNAGSGGTLSIVAGPTVANANGPALAVPATVVSTSADTLDYFTPAEVAASITPVGAVNSGTVSGNPAGSAGNGSASAPCTPSASGVTPVVTCMGTSLGSPGGVGTGTSTSGTAACPPGQTCTGVTDSLTGGTDCVTPPACVDTDPVQCGIVNQEWLFRCESAADADVVTAIGTVTGPVNTVVDSSTALSENGTATLNAINPSSGECPAPLSVTIAGKSLSLDIFSQVCTFAGYLAFVIMAIAYMVAGRIMFQGAVSNSF